jgi:hypothetical protein
VPCRQLVFEDQLGVIEQAADQRRLAVINRAAGEKAEQALVLMRAHIGAHALIIVRDKRFIFHQK